MATVALRSGATVRGRVTHRDGSPFAGVSVNMSAGRGVAGFGSFGMAVRESQVRTGADGTYALRAVLPGEGRLRFQGELDSGQVIAERAIELQDGGESACDLSLPEGKDITGTVVDGKGRPMASMDVRAAGNIAQQVRSNMSRTDQAGRFCFRVMVAVRWALGPGPLPPAPGRKAPQRDSVRSSKTDSRTTAASRRTMSIIRANCSG